MCLSIRTGGNQVDVFFSLSCNSPQSVFSKARSGSWFKWKTSSNAYVRTVKQTGNVSDFQRRSVQRLLDCQKSPIDLTSVLGYVYGCVYIAFEQCILVFFCLNLAISPGGIFSVTQSSFIFAPRGNCSSCTIRFKWQWVNGKRCGVVRDPYVFSWLFTTVAEIIGTLDYL